MNVEIILTRAHIISALIISKNMIFWNSKIITYRVFIKYCVFLRVLESLPALPRQHSAAIGCTKNYQPIGVTVHSHCVESFEGLLQRGRGCSELWKNTIFPEHPVCKSKLWEGNFLLSMFTSSTLSNILLKWKLSFSLSFFYSPPFLSTPPTQPTI